MFAFLEVARQSLLLQARSRLLWLIVILIVVGSLVFLFIPPHADLAPGDQVFGIVCAIAGLTLVVPLATLYFATQIVHGDLEDRTSTYLFVRPIHRSSILLGRWLATVVLGWFLVLVGVTVLYLVITLSGRNWLRGQVPDVGWWWTFVFAGAVMTMGYAAIGCLFATFFKRPLVISLLFWFGWEQIVSRTPPQAGVRNATLWEPMRRWIFLELRPRGRLGHYLVGDLRNYQVPIDLLPDPLLAVLKFTVITLGLALFIYWRREYDSRPRE
jgi:ABC-2 family transporter protein